jgi:hypothetical protein
LNASSDTLAGGSGTKSIAKEEESQECDDEEPGLRPRAVQSYLMVFEHNAHGHSSG